MKLPRSNDIIIWIFLRPSILLQHNRLQNPNLLNFQYHQVQMFSLTLALFVQLKDKSLLYIRQNRDFHDYKNGRSSKQYTDLYIFTHCRHIILRTIWVSGFLGVFRFEALRLVLQKFLCLTLVQTLSYHYLFYNF